MSAEVPAGPPRVQIQTQSGCNGRCVFCPNAAVLASGLEQGRMSPGLFHKIIDELAELTPQRISLYLMNEPLLDPRLPEFTRYAAEKVPGATTLVTTNGLNLDEALGLDLIAAGLKRLKVSLQSLDPETNRKLMGSHMDPARVVDNVLTMKRLIEQHRAELDLRVSMITTALNAYQTRRTRRFWRKHGIRLVTSSVENRGGNIDEASSLSKGAMQDRSRHCIRPYREMCILFNGDVVLCCVDWWRTAVLGNVREQSIREVWNGPRFRAVRAALKAGDRDSQPKICLNCAESSGAKKRGWGIKRLLGRGIGKT
ncbi:MAG TPA: radical SAM protein [Candidatus Hydrogenedentes bacterium]|nr:radical SAM protein [Candidatus Hydrogenedentota bacterium]